MNNLTAYKKKINGFCLTATHFTSDAPRFSDASDGNDADCFIYIVNGQVSVRAGQLSLTLGAGDVFFITRNTHYTVIWTGTPKTEYYCIQTEFGRQEFFEPNMHASLCRLDALSNDVSGESVKSIFMLLEDEDKRSNIRAIGLFCNLLADAYPELKNEPCEETSPVLKRAIKYIEDHYLEDFSISDLSLHCFVSESRIHHVFTEQLGTTPVKYRNSLRVEHAAHHLRSTDLRIDPLGVSQIVLKGSDHRLKT